MTQSMKETRWSLWYIKQLLHCIATNGWRIKCLDNGFNSVWLMSIQVIESQIAFY